MARSRATGEIDTANSGRAQVIDQTPNTWRDAQGRLRDDTGRWQDANGVWHSPSGRWQDRNGTWHGNDNSGWNGRAETLAADTVIPVRLDTALSSNGSRRGDRFSATVRSSGNDYYGMLPSGTRVEGRVVTARPQRGNQPGLLELDFQRLRFPNGHTVSMDGDLVSMDSNGIIRDENGRVRATGNARDQRMVYAGYGAGAGLLVGLLTKKPLEGTVIGGVLGYLAGQVQHDRGGNPSNVRLSPGTEFGVRLSKSVTIRQSDID